MNKNSLGTEIFQESNEDTPQLAPNEKTLDLVFVSDCTSSMGSYIASTKKSISEIVHQIVAAEKVNVRFGLVEYRDHPPQDSTFVTRTSDFTSDVQKMQQRINEMAARGGGDGPEAVADGLSKALNLKWRQNAVKIVVVIADAPPHGIEQTGDGFPNGCPCEIDPLQMARHMAETGISIYSVLCEPALGNYKFARDFFMAIAKMTGGQHLPLTSANLLPKAIVAMALEELSLQEIQKVFEEEADVLRQQGQIVTEAALEARMKERMNDPALKNLQTKNLEITSIYSSGYDCSNVDRFVEMDTMVSEGLSEHVEPVYNNTNFESLQCVRTNSNSSATSKQLARVNQRVTKHKK